MARRKSYPPCFNSRTITINIAASLFLASHVMAAQADMPDATKSNTYTGPHALVNESGHCAKIEFKLVSGESKILFLSDDSVDTTDEMTHYVDVPVTFYTGANTQKNGDDVQCEGDVLKPTNIKVRHKFVVLTSDDVS